MKICHPALEEPFQIDESKVSIVVIENQRMLSHMIQELRNQINGDLGEFIFCEDEKNISIEKRIQLIISVFDLDFNTKRNISKLYSQLAEKSVDEENYYETDLIKSKLLEYVERLISDEKSELKYNDNLEISDIFKIMKIEFDESSGILAERIINYLIVMNDYFHFSCYVFVNLKSYLSNEELISFYQYVIYNKITILLLENSERMINENYEKQIIIDSDLCLI